MTAGERGIVLSGRDDRAYVPVSALAVTAFLVSLAAATCLIVVWAGARRAGKPAQYPLLLIPQIIALILGILAVYRVRSSDGTVGGARLAKAAWIIALVFGGSFGATLVATELAIRNQAEQFTMEWFHKITTEPPEASFLYTLDPMNRQSIDEKDTVTIAKRFSGEMHGYKTSEVVRLLQRAGPQYQAQSRGLKGWDMAEGGYFVVQMIELRTPEGKYDVEVPVLGRDIPNVGRAWQIQGPKVGVVGRQTTALGRLVIDLQYDQRRFLTDWVDKINAGKLHEAFLDTLAPTQRSAFQDRPDSPEFQRFRQGDFLTVEGSQPTPEQKKKFADAIFQPNAINLSPGSATKPVGPPQLDFSANGRIRIESLAELTISQNIGDVMVATISLDLEDEKLSARFNELRGSDWLKLPILPTVKELSVQEIDQFPNRTYRVIGIDVRPKAQRLVSPEPRP